MISRTLIARLEMTTLRMMTAVRTIGRPGGYHYLSLGEQPSGSKSRQNSRHRVRGRNSRHDAVLDVPGAATTASTRVAAVEHDLRLDQQPVLRRLHAVGAGDREPH